MPPISLSTAFDQANAIVRREAALLAPVALALIALPTVVLDRLSALPGVTRDSAQAIGLLNPVALIVTLLASLVVSVLALTPGISVGEAFRLAVRRMGVAIGASLLLGVGFALLIVPAVPVLIGGQAAVQRMGAGGALLFLLYIAAVGAAVALALVRLLLLNTVVAVEPLGVIATLRRSWRLTRGMFWRLFGLAVLFVSASVIASFAIVAAGGTVLLGLGRLLGDPDLGRLLLAVLASLVNAAFLTWFYVMLACIYRQLAESTRGI